MIQIDFIESHGAIKTCILIALQEPMMMAFERVKTYSRMSSLMGAVLLFGALALAQSQTLRDLEAFAESQPQPQATEGGIVAPPSPTHHQQKKHHRKHCVSCEKPSSVDHAASDVGDLRDAALSNYSSATMLRIARAAILGFVQAAKNMCYRSVKNILSAAHASPRQDLLGASAIDAMRDLPKAGFTNTYPNNCEAPGVIRVYEGPATGMSRHQAKVFMRQEYHTRLLLGDIYGHIEVVGSNGRYYHFAKGGSREPINERMGDWRRKLVGCFVK